VRHQRRHFAEGVGEINLGIGADWFRFAAHRITQAELVDLRGDRCPAFGMSRCYYQQAWRQRVRATAQEFLFLAGMTGSE